MTEIIGEVSDPDFVRLPDADIIFGVRSRRLHALSANSQIGPYLRFLSEIVGVQHSTQSALPPPRPFTRQGQTGVPLMSAEQLRDHEELNETLTCFAEMSSIPSAPPEAEEARRRLCGMPPSERLELALSIFEAAYPIGQLAESLYVAAALQLFLTRQTRVLDANAIRPVGDGVCPLCGAAPVASVIVGWAKAARARYCCCSLCSTMWNVVRIKCTACGETTGVRYFSLQGESRDIAIETCSVCNSYIKHLHQHHDERIEPFADDLSSFPLDTLAKDRNFHRIATSPLMPVRVE